MYQKSKGVPQTMQRENGKDLGSGVDRGVFGNDNEATNEIAGEMFTFIANEIESYRSKFGTMTSGILPDTEGPGAVLKSVSHLPHDRFVQGTLLNMKIEPEMLNSENGIMQMMAQGIRHILRNLERMYRMRSLPGRNRNRYTAAVSDRRKQCQRQEECSG